IDLLRGFLLARRRGARLAHLLAQLALAHRLFLPGEDPVEVELRFLRRCRGVRRVLRQAGDGRVLARRRRFLLGRLRLRGGERDRRLVQVERDAERDHEAEGDAGEEAEQKTTARALARAGGGSRSGHHIFSGALTPRSASPLASVWRTA